MKAALDGGADGLVLYLAFPDDVDESGALTTKGAAIAAHVR